MPTTDPLPLAVDLMRVESTSGREGAVVALAERLLAERGWTVQRIPVSPGRDDLLATSGRDPVATLSTHLDTVPPYVPPRVEGETLFGRGACDAKGIAAAMVCAGERLRGRGVPVALLLVVGEETAHDGAHAANASPLRPPTARVLIDGEPTESTLAVGTKGALRFTLRTRGRAAHSAYPHLGDSATARLVRLLSELDGLALPADPLLGATTVHVGMLAGGVADNVIAPWAEARLMARLVTSPESALELFTRWVDGRAEVEPGVSVPPVRLGVVPGFATSVAAFATDIPALGAWGAPFLFGPGSIHVAHTDDEHVPIAELRAAVDAYERLVVGAVG
ncbi:MAG: Acetylornithine deacetylase [uncultured Gemmatimonadaceae bacterium]|uniref:Acetylornithine deacetylase n=1 Tax=uncultured Gemmatimonadaceae bacterium TaxID=246130 RepID=A0A6J4MED2_9BACT|nr:MAG: Acetylornithine deacetylase [uncultured Gemmatimonadaceae bacterium]